MAPPSSLRQQALDPPLKEDMEKVNIKFHDNGTVTFQHKKILEFVPELSADKNVKVTVPNIPLLTLSTQSIKFSRFFHFMLSMALRAMKLYPFVTVTPEELVFGYDDPLITMANTFLPKHRKPMKKMGLLIGRNGTLNEVSTIFTGHTNMKEFGLLDRLNGLDHLPYWSEPPCNNIRASEGASKFICEAVGLERGQTKSREDK
ncbi:unnamed protein product [Timema podura]|uniref:Uncharacterized protein n=1 Tax=Timema podura TaxID=61482 RepID=A0ABN7NVL0_TIMPD|nr:unnamed protein product [Timema podura]